MDDFSSLIAGVVGGVGGAVGGGVGSIWYLHRGIAERLRTVTGVGFPRAALSGGVAGVRHRTLVVNLPGSTRGVRDMLAALEPIVEHAVDIVRGAATDHSPGAP